MVSTICLLGTEMYVFSLVRIRVLRSPIFSMVPVNPFTFTCSPTVKGLSKKMIKEAIKFSILSLVARATAAPTKLNPVKILPIFLLKENFKTSSTPIMMRMTLKKSLKNIMS